MCEAAVYLQTDGEQKLVMENVTSVKPLGENRYQVSGLFGDMTEIDATLVLIDIQGNKILFESVS